MDKLPVEILSAIVDHCPTRDLINLQATSKPLNEVARDNLLWRKRCYREVVQAYHQPTARRVGMTRNTEHAPSSAARWDPTSDEENICWYSEYVARHSPISVTWLEIPDAGQLDNGKSCRIREVGGMGLLKDISYNGSDKIIGPLDDGTVCVWDLSRSSDRESRKSRGRAIAESQPGLLTSYQDGRADKNLVVSECVSIDSPSNRAYFVVDTILHEVDISTCQLVSRKRYPSPITALSQETIDYSTSLSVATTSSLHINDPRLHLDLSTTNESSRLDIAPLAQPGTQSILHPPLPNSNTICLAGRVPSILVYDRRYLPRIQSTAYSGSRLCCLAAIPALPKCVQVEDDKSVPYQSIIACGEYSGRGSLELYGLSALTDTKNPEHLQPPTISNALLQNRQSSSYSKLLSVAAHGARIIYSDSHGIIRWTERDCRTLTRAWDLNYSSPLSSESNPRNTRNWLAFPSRPSASKHDVARKLIPTGETLSDDEILVWTGDRIARLIFSMEAESNNKMNRSHEETEHTRREEEYSEAMRRSLWHHLDQINIMQTFGLG
ncbi:hypothetical protein FQN57_007462 [Myotisia sp. PD_48]|nr:hypothetical protein FQN57_007462 [Myotisia sp. PD_48]